MTVRDQLGLRRIVELTGAPLIATAEGADEQAMETWRDAGAPVVLVTGGTEAVRTAVDAAVRVPAPRQRREGGRTPLVPAASTTASHDHDDDDF